MIPVVISASIAAGRVGLPDLEHRVWNRIPCSIQYRSANFDPDPLHSSVGRARVEQVVLRWEEIGARTEVGLANEIGAALPRQRVVKERTNRLPRSLAK